MCDIFFLNKNQNLEIQGAQQMHKLHTYKPNIKNNVDRLVYKKEIGE